MELVFQTGPGVTLDLGADIDTQLEWLQREQPDYLLSYPSNIAELARCSRQRRIRLARLREVRTIGEAMAPETRKLCREAWGVPLTDAYSSQEAGYLALQCPGHEHYHVQSESVMLEILDEQGVACAPGETGRVVLTTLHNFAMPLIRYEIGDYAEAGPPCPCGRGLPVITRILGRQRNMLTLPDGRRRWPSFPSEKWSYAAPVRQLQLVQRARERIEVRVVPERALSDGERARLVGAMQDCLGRSFILELREVAEIPRSASLKYEDFISEIAT
jgi:phenylacetate-CoA ligase